MRELLRVKDLSVAFPTPDGVVRAVNGVSFSIRGRETVGLVGESGCGKSVTALSILGLVPPPGRIDGGEVRFRGMDLLRARTSQLRRICGAKIAMIFQDPMSSLNPVMPVGKQISEALEVHLGLDGARAHKRTVELLSSVGIPDARERASSLPHEFSGGMRQRVMIAMALSCRPELLLADEPTTALDMTVQAEILELVRDLRDKRGLSILWITHDLGVIAELAERVLVMYAGYIVEEAPIDALFTKPRHPYTVGLLESLPHLENGEEGELHYIPGTPPDPIHLPPGCPFHPRCQHAMKRCRRENPRLDGIAPGQRVACWFATQEADS